jgi:hypothetical protein
MPLGKKAGERCIQLSDDNGCMIFGNPERPAVCASLSPSAEMCRNSAEQAFEWLISLERLTAPNL